MMDSAQVKIVKTVRVSTGRPMVPMDELDTVWFCPFAQPCSWVKRSRKIRNEHSRARCLRCGACSIALDCSQVPSRR